MTGCILVSAGLFAQIPMERVLSRISVPSEGSVRGLVDLTGFPHTAEQMDRIGPMCEEAEAEALRTNAVKYGLDEESSFAFGICPHDDYMLAARVYVHIQKYIKAHTVILVGNAHWAETFGVRNRLIFGDFEAWKGPYGAVAVSDVRDELLARLRPDHYTVHRKLVETEHSLEALIPFLQYYNRDVRIVPLFIPLSDWRSIDNLGHALAGAVSEIVRERNWRLGSDVAVLCSADFQHYGDYGWSYYDYHPFGCDASGYEEATKLDLRLIRDYIEGPADQRRIERLFSELIDQNDISRYRVTWCSRFAVPFAVNFVRHLFDAVEDRIPEGLLLKYGTTLSDPWLPLQEMGLGLTGDANLHHFVTFGALGFR
jgi:AmmeMemoRadiSam system protein B